jgi:hypothetical protein
LLAMSALQRAIHRGREDPPRSARWRPSLALVLKDKMGIATAWLMEEVYATISPKPNLKGHESLTELPDAKPSAFTNLATDGAKARYL